jgi:ArsR family transcriptional regulator
MEKPMSVLLEKRQALPVRPPDRGFDEEGIAAVAKALAHPARVHIVRLLLEKQSCIGCDIVDEVGLAQSTVSEHLRILKAAGVVTGDIERPRVCYSLNPEALAPLAGLLNTILEGGAEGTLGGSICCASGKDC